MKLVTFEEGRSTRIGVLTDGGIVDLSRASPSLPKVMIALIEAWGILKEKVSNIVSTASEYIPLESVHLLAPVLRPSKIMAIGLNYAAHIEEAGMKIPQRQTWFSKQINAVSGPYDPIELPIASEQLDYEAELVVVIGRRAKHVERAAALSYVFGYCIGNDVSVRDFQAHSSQWVVGKSFDTHAPYGPWITTSDELDDPQTLGVRCFVNGQPRQIANTDQMIFKISDQIVYLSQAMTLEAGDVIFTGTCEGVGIGFKPPKWLRVGDRCRVEIDRLGVIENVVKEEVLPVIET